jgi:hypothetical protein
VSISLIITLLQLKNTYTYNIFVGKIAALESYLKPALEKIFPALTVNEWFGTHLEPQVDQLKQLLQNAEYQFAVGGRTRNFKPNLGL